MLLAVRIAGLLLFNVGRATVVSVEMKVLTVLTVVNVVRAENRSKSRVSPYIFFLEPPFRAAAAQLFAEREIA